MELVALQRLVRQRLRPRLPASAILRDVFHADAVHRADRDAQLATGAARLDDGVHELVAADDRIGWTHRHAQRATDAPGFVDHGDGARRFGAVVGVQGPAGLAGDGSQSRDTGGSAGRALVDRCGAVGDGLGVGRAVRKAAAGALRLRQGGMDPLGQRTHEAWATFLTGALSAVEVLPLPLIIGPALWRAMNSLTCG